VQIEKVEGGIKVTTDKGDEIITDVVMFATGEMQFCGKVAGCVWGNNLVDFVVGLIFQQPFGIQKHDTCSIHCTST
jgi:thioredoxin reductase